MIVSQCIYNLNSNSMKSTYSEMAIPLISVDPQTSKYVLTNQAAQMLKSIPGPIGVVSVAGLYRTGKSYLLNRMILDRPSGFGVGPTVNPCTKGLWCWGKPIKGKSSEGQTINILVVDTEGIGALDEDQTHDTRIFTLAILASSCFIYNSTGSIDENALENLSLVVNLTKHIQISTQNSGQQDLDKIASHFPSFYWVVRDFTLQLVDSEEKKISEKEYLERALALQKGQGEDIEEKNRIRKLLTTFFKERQCFTLVRPHTDEDKLQNLDKMSLEDLRPQFTEQVIRLRKTILNGVKPKTFHNKKLNGQMYLSMLNSYVSAINNGAVPNIENAWSYMCRQQCTKLMNECMQMFERQKEQINIPCSEQNFFRIYSIEDNVFEYFRKSSVGDDSEFYMKQLKKQIRKIIGELDALNKQRSKQVIKNYMKSYSEGLKKKLKNNFYSQFSQFENDIKKIHTEALEQGPKVTASQLNIEKVMNKLWSQGCNYIFKKMKNEINIQKKSNQQKSSVYQNEMDIAKKDFNSEIQSSKRKIESLDKEKIEMTNKILRMQSDLQKVQEQKSSGEEMLNKNLIAKKNELEDIKERLQKRMNDMKENEESLKIKIQDAEFEREKERALTEQKLEKQKKKIQDLQQNERKLQSNYTLEKNELNQKLRQQNSNYQLKIQELERNLNRTKDENERLNEDLEQNQLKVKNVQEKLEAKEKKYKDEIMNKKNDLEQLKLQFQQEKIKLDSENSNKKNEIFRVREEFEEKSRKVQKEFQQYKKEAQDKFNNYETQIQISRKNEEREKKKVEDMNQRMEEMQSSHKVTIELIEKQLSEQRSAEYSERLNDLKLNHEKQMQQIKESKIKLREEKEEDIRNLQQKLQEIRTNCKLLENQIVNKNEEEEDLKNELRQEKQKNLRRRKDLETEKEQEILRLQSDYTKKMNEYQTDIEGLKKIIEEQNYRISSEIDSEMNKLRIYHELEKEKLEKRVSEEKEKANKKINVLKEEYERMMNEKEDEFYNQLQEKENQINLNNQFFKENISKIQNEYQNVRRDFVELSKRHEEEKEEHTKKYNHLYEQHQSQLKSANEKITELQNKKEEYFTELGKKENEIHANNHKINEQKNQIDRQGGEIESYKIENHNMREKYENKLEEKEVKIKEVSELYQKQTSNYTKQIAVLKQDITFKESRNKELQVEKENIKNSLNQEITQFKERYRSQTEFLKEKASEEKKTSSEKIEKLKETIRENDAKGRKEYSDKEKQLLVIKEKHENLEQKYKEIENRTNVEIESIKLQLTREREGANLQRKQLKKELQVTQSSLNKLRDQYNELHSTKEREVKLLENELEHYVSDLEKVKEDKNQKIRNLEKALDVAHRRHDNDRNSFENKKDQIYQQCQKKSQQESANLHEKYLSKVTELQKRNKEHQGDLKKLKQNLAIESQAKKLIENKMEKRKMQFEEKQKKLEEEIQKLKVKKEEKEREFQNKLDEQKQTFKKKVIDLQGRMKEFEEKNKSMTIEMSIKNAKWQNDKQSYKDKIQEFKDTSQDLQRKVDKLNKENERFRIERRKSTAGHNTSNISKWNNTFIEEKKVQKEEQKQENKENNLIQQ